jgi:5,5'-dehydrodivanillate O-demethylase
VYWGFIFVYLGESPTPPLRRFPDFEKPGVLETDPPEPWPCNVVNRLENDPAHVPWTHRESTLRTGQHRRHMEGRDAQHYARQYVETDYGIATVGGNRNLIPNVNALKVPVKTLGWENLWEYRLIFHVPVDDQNSVAFDVNLVPGLDGQEAERFRQQRREIQEGDDPAPYQMAKAIMAGKMTVRDVPAELSLYKQFWIEDYVTQVSLGAVADREQEHLGRNDQKIILRRKILKREITALVEGRPLKNWTSSNLYEPLRFD